MEVRGNRAWQGSKAGPAGKRTSQIGPRHGRALEASPPRGSCRASGKAAGSEEDMLPSAATSASRSGSD